jgi:hypothetical protein
MTKYLTLPCLLAALTLTAGTARGQTGASLVDGEWAGRGAFQLGATLLGCSEIRMKFVGSATLYGVRDGFVTCETITKSFPMNDDFEVAASDDILYRGEKVGHVTGNQLEVVVPGPNGVDTDFILRREGDLLYYTEAARKAGSTPVFGMVAILKKVSATP